MNIEFTLEEKTVFLEARGYRIKTKTYTLTRGHPAMPEEITRHEYYALKGKDIHYMNAAFEKELKRKILFM